MKTRNADMPAMATTRTVGYVSESTSGLTKREYFAGLAMQGLCSHSGDYHQPEHLAQDAIMYADALLAELEKQQ